MMAELVIWGTGGHAKVVFDTAVAMGYTRIRFIDDCAAARAELYGCGIAAPPVDVQGSGQELINLAGLKRMVGWTPWSAADALAGLGGAVHAGSARLRSRPGGRLRTRGAAPPIQSKNSSTVEFIVAIGDNRARAHCYSRGLRQGWTPATLIHPSAEISPHSEISPGCVVLPRAVINAGAVIGPNCIINTGAIVEHDCRIAGHAHISPAATLGGNVQVDAFAHVGIGACVLPGSRIGSGSIAGAGAVILTSIPEGVTAVGVPARILSRSKAGAR
jgi:sugar O-acyltransferase (sialic acid O-acetyltransferase NeuD family)